MKISGLDRALRYFIRQAELYVLCLIAGSFAMSGYIWLIQGYDRGILEMLKSVPSGIVFISIIVLYSSGMSSAQYWYSIPISFGCRRKNAFIGNLAMNMLFIAESLVFYMLAVRILQTDVFAVSMAVILPVYLVMEGISKLLGIAVIKWGKVTFIVMTAALVMASVFCGFLIFFAGEGKEALALISVSEKYLTFPWKWAGLLAGTGICAAANVAGYRILSHFEVKV